MKKLIILALALQTSLISVNGFCQDADSPAARKAAAAEYLKISPASKELDLLYNNMSTTNKTDHFSKLPPEQQKFAKQRDADLKKILITKENTQAMEQATIDSLVKNFTAAEINALTKFYSLKEGMAIREKLPILMRETTMPIMQKIGPEMSKVMGANRPPSPPVAPLKK